MGITGELVRSVFSKSRTTKTNDTHVKSNNVLDKKRWKSSVRAYLCGDELLNSVIAEEDSNSVKSSEATVTQPVPEDDESVEQDQNHRFDEETAAIIIQSAFRGFMVRHLMMAKSAGVKNGFLKGIGSPSRESMATSIEVQTGNSVGVISIQEESPSVSNKLQQKPKSLFFKPKEDWDDSTLDSSASKMRIQNRREAMTRRERALAYAFSQQLRICTKKKQMKSDGMEMNMGWSWLERWMATRQPEGSSGEDSIIKQPVQPATTMKTKAVVRRKFLNLSFEEKESCGSNEVPVHIDGSKYTDMETKDGCKTPRNRLKATRSISRRKTIPTYNYQKEHDKVSRSHVSKEVVRNKRQKMKQLGSKRETVSEDSASLMSTPDHSLSGQNSKSDP